MNTSHGAFRTPGRRQPGFPRLVSRPPAALVVALACWAAPAASLHAQSVPPGVPEPGLVIWGSVVNQTNPAQAIAITSASWTVTDGTKTAVFSGSSEPPTRIVNLNGQSYYILQVPFDTRQIGTVTLADPATVGTDSFPLRSATPPTYTLLPAINGAIATVRSVDGAPASGTNVPVAGFTSALRGRVIRVDLGIIPVPDDYDAWAVANFGSASLPQAARTADPDGDGMNNAAEHAAGTNPNDPSSALKILALTVQSSPLRAVLGWQSASNHSYVVETATDPLGPWSPLGSAIPSAGAATQATLDLAGVGPKRFYRIKLAP
jgi:hypothetical protein